MKKHLPIIIASTISLLILFGGGLYVWQIKTGGYADKNTPKKETTASYKNKKGEIWKIEKGEYSFTVSSGSELPKFLSGKIDPLDVKVGDIQTMRVVVLDEAEPKSVIAEIGTDNGTTTISLKLVATDAYTYQDLLKEPLTQTAKGDWVPNIAKETIFTKYFGWMIRPASAASKNKYTYEAKWKVEDTHTATYRTIFTTVGSNDKKDTITLAWSDPNCSWNSTGYLLGSCTAMTEGVDASNIYLNGYTMTLSTGGGLFLSPGYTLTIGTGSILLPISGQAIQTSYRLCQVDADADGFPSASTLWNCTAEGVLGGVGTVRYQANIPFGNRSVVDCNDASYSLTNTCSTCGAGLYYPSSACPTPQKVFAAPGQASVASGVVSASVVTTLKCVPKPSMCENLGCSTPVLLYASSYACGTYVGGLMDDFETACTGDLQVYCR